MVSRGGNVCANEAREMKKSRGGCPALSLTVLLMPVLERVKGIEPSS
jgi:hypothetical protein